MGLFHGYVSYGCSKIGRLAAKNLIWRQSSGCLEIDLFVRSGVCQIKKQRSTSNQTLVLRSKSSFTPLVQWSRSQLRDDINDNSSRVFLGLIVPCSSGRKCFALGLCAGCGSDVGLFRQKVEEGY